MKSIDFREKYFLILYPSLSRLAIWIEGIAVKVEIVGSSLTTYNIYLFLKNIFIFYHKSWLARFLQDLLRVKVNVIEFILKHYIS